MLARMPVIAMIMLAAGCAQKDAPGTFTRDQTRIRSPLGFSFLPPPGEGWAEEPGEGWAEESGKSGISYSKITDPALVTVYAMALQVNCTPDTPGKDALVAFVRDKKDQWGSDGRFAPVVSDFLADPEHATCVRYRMLVNDRGANNRGRHPSLPLHVVGRYCTLPQHPRAAVDIVYSIRHVPDYDAGPLKAEGEAFLNSLALDTLPATSGTAVAVAHPCKVP